MNRIKVTGLIAVLVLFCSVFVIALCFGAYVKKSGVSLPERKQYQYVHMNQKGESPVVATVAIPRMKSDYFHKKDEFGNDILISNFGLEEYKCTGSCYCNEGKRNAITLSRGIFTLVAAVTFAVGIQIATKQLQKDCVQEHSGQCTKSAIESFVDSCSALGNSHSEVNFFDKLEEKRCIKSYMCHGSCTTCDDDFMSFGGRRSISGNDDDGSGCSGKSQQGEVVFETQSCNPEQNRRMAEEKFKKQILNVFCSAQNIDENQLSPEQKDHIVQMMVQQHGDLMGRRRCCGGKQINESIQCRETHGRGSCGKCDGDH